MSVRPPRHPLGLLLLLPIAIGAASPAPAADPTSPLTPPAAGGGGGPQALPAAGGGGTAQPPNAREQQVLERIRQLKTPRWRSFGACRYDWGGWRMSEAGVRATSSECGEPALSSGVAVHCDTLRVARRSGEGPWEAWRLPLSIEESKTLGGEDRMVASLCANVTSAPPAAGTRGSSTKQPVSAPPKAPAPTPSGATPRSRPAA